MSLPNQINKDVPAGSDLPSTLDNRIRNLALGLEDILGIPDQTNISNAGFAFVSSGLSSIRLQDSGATPSVSGHLQMKSNNLMIHDGTSAYSVVLDTRTGVVSNKTFPTATLTDPTITGTVSGVATYNSTILLSPVVQGTISGVLDFQSTHTLALNPPWRLTATVAANALTIAVKNVDGNDATATSTIPFAFHSPTLTDGRTIIGSVSTALAVVVPATGTLGFTASQTSRIWVGGYYDTGTMKPFAWHALDSANSNYSIKTPGKNTISTTAISTASDSAGVGYSTTAVTNAPWQWLGYVEIQSDATPGNWANNPTVVRPVMPWGPKPGDVIQDIYQDDGLLATGTGTIPNDNSIPQQTEGNQFMKQSITYTSAVNLAEVEHVGVYGESTNVNYVVALFQGSGANAIGVWYGAQLGGADSGETMFARFRHVPGTANSSFEYKFRAGLESAGTTYFNSDTTTPKFAGLCKSSIRLRELFI